MDLQTLLFGIYPRSERLRREYGRWERGMIGSEEVGTIISEEKSSFYEMARTAMLDFFTDPLFNWHDILRPVALSIEGINLGPLRRYKETNTFYREPLIKAVGKVGDMESFREVKDNPPFPVFHRIPGKSYLHFLPGIYSFIRMSSLHCSFEEAVSGLERAYSKIVDQLSIENLLIYEPLEVENIDIYSGLASTVSLFLVLPQFTGDHKKTNVGAHSIISHDPYKFARQCEVPGVMLVDALSTKVGDRIVDKVRSFTDDFDKIIVSNNESFDFLPRVIADRKLMNFRGN
jgi:5-methyltetrahydropteroyltriglutamate--homocysteine methyltransferase